MSAPGFARGTRALFLLLPQALLAGCAELADDPDAPEGLGELEQAVQEIGPEKLVSIPGMVARDPRTAWIRSNPIDFSNGHALVGYTVDDPVAGAVAAWSHSLDWFLSTPSWEPRLSNAAPDAWPEPANFLPPV
jgi:hypothetical protein